MKAILFLRIKMLPALALAVMGTTISSSDLHQMIATTLQDKPAKIISISQKEYVLYPETLVRERIRHIPRPNTEGCYDQAMWNLACLRQSCQGIAAGLIFGGKVWREMNGVPLPQPVETNHLWVIVFTQEGTAVEVGGLASEQDYITSVRF
jgi:hypothetical protein